jgi:hypothetical protein
MEVSLPLCRGGALGRARGRGNPLWRGRPIAKCSRALVPTALKVANNDHFGSKPPKPPPPFDPSRDLAVNGLLEWRAVARVLNGRLLVSNAARYLMRAGGKLDAAQATALLAETRAALLTIKPAYDRGIAWAQANVPTAPSRRVGALTLPDGARPISNGRLIAGFSRVACPNDPRNAALASARNRCLEFVATAGRSDGEQNSRYGTSRKAAPGPTSGFGQRSRRRPTIIGAALRPSLLR